MMRVPVQPRMLQWAVDRAGLSRDAARSRFVKFDDWLAGTLQPTLNQLQDFARATYAPIGYFFLDKPPAVTLPIPDFRTPGGARPDDPSPDLLDTIYLYQQRQEWYASYARSTGAEALPFVGSLAVEEDVVRAADTIRNALDFDVSVRRRLPTWEDALRQLIQLADDAGVLV